MIHTQETLEIPPVDLVNISLLKTDGQNPNKMASFQMDALIESMKRYGFLMPIITDIDYVIADGEHRLNAAKTLGYSQVPVIRLPTKDVDRRLIRQIMNKIRGEHVLNQDVQEYMRIMEQGRTDDLRTFLNLRTAQLNSLMRTFNARREDANFIPAPSKDTEIQRGDLFLLGEHRLMCGDATIKEDMAALTMNEPIDSIQADPPYGVYGREWDSLRKRKVSAGGSSTFDDIPRAAYQAWSEKWLSNIPVKEHNTAYIWINGKNITHLLGALDKLGWYPGSMLIWVKNSMVLASTDYKPQHEICFYGWKGKHHFYGKQRTDTIFLSRPTKSPYHPTTKPVELIQPLIEDSVPPEGVAIDPFGGSGTTLIAAERAGRRCYMMEIDPIYCDVIIRRWEHWTNKKATKLIKGDQKRRLVQPLQEKS